MKSSFLAKIIVFLLLIFGFLFGFYFFSLKQRVNPYSFFLSVQNDLHQVQDVVFLADSSSLNKRQGGIPLSIFHGKYFDQKLMIIKSLCLYYQNPFNGHEGKLIFEMKESLSGCDELHWDGLVLEKISQLKIKNMMNHQELQIQFLWNQKHYEFMLTLSGVHQLKPFLPAKNLDHIGPYQGSSITEKFSPAKYTLGGLKDSFSNQRAIVCYQVNDDCEVTMSDQCDLCQFGHYPVVGSSCPTKLNMYCGVNRCGQRDEPACPRGVVHREKNPKRESLDQIRVDHCENPSEFGFCQDDLEAECNAQGIIICRK